MGVLCYVRAKWMCVAARVRVVVVFLECAVLCVSLILCYLILEVGAELDTSIMIYSYETV